MSHLKERREAANREPDPEVRRQRIAELDKLEADIRDADKRLAAVKARLADSQSGRKRFFSWTEFVLGLGVVGALAVSFYYELSSGVTMILVAIVALVIAGALLLRIWLKLKNVDRSA
jgi:hypothetical protein